MASAAAPSTPSGGVNSSMWANQPPSKNWGRNGEPGSTFRGNTRGRPARGGGGRGGRGGRGGGRANGPNPPRPEDKVPKVNGAQVKESTSATPTAASAAPTAPAPAPHPLTPVLSKLPNNRTKDLKPPARKVSEAKPPRKVVPPIVIQPPAVPSANSPVSATTPNRSRKKRNSIRSTSSVSSSKKSPSTESSTSLLRPDKSPVVRKDLPPHLAAAPPPETPSYDKTYDIDALVERVRAVAMDRPNTPGSHIDWAGDDDDSLPDLDDWGVKSVTGKSTSNVSAGQADLISPILVDALKPLPSIEQGSPLVISSTAPPPEETPVKVALEAAPQSTLGDNTPRGASAGSVSKTTIQTKEKLPAEKVEPAAPKGPKQSEASTKPSATSTIPAAAKEPEPKKSPLKQSALPLHPSLPAKPVFAIDAASKRVSRKPAPVQTPGSAADVESPVKSGLSESMHAPPPNGVTAEDKSDDSSPSPKSQAVAASVHAPVHSAPSHVTTHSTPTSSFQPSHGRAHTIGRPGAIRPPFSSPHGAFPDGHGGEERLSHRDRINHARTHSSPPTGPGTSTAHSRTVHATRPVITVDALSRLARTLGAAPKREAATVAIAKE
ncbi:hypothetical protein C8Q80DRAFT_1118850 [Daedaleopsis nitida]|nr:hypothetical protein C8Q80DRAFT_1118850 [Daedaleopsis nitida]